ncbi:MAG: excinuclease ABC subunit C, partial [Candidatus Kapabacteria bacterium]|nr:excinuclease ABC subunit C [Candidatus Kapabacteria bacterium]
YIGKAKNIRNRVRQYFDRNRHLDAKSKVLVSKIADVECIVTDSEAEALILENILIKQHKPKYNILLKDDKSYPYIRITNEEYPRLFSTRTVIRDGSKYFGPYTDGRYLYSLLKTLRTLFPIRSCDLPLTERTIDDRKYKVCLDYHIKKCEGPCEAIVGRKHYNEHIKLASQILQGKTRDVEKQLESQMSDLAAEMKFEDAAQIRNRLQMLREYSAKQKVMTTELVDRDVVAFARDAHQACTVIFTIRDGKLTGKQQFIASNVLDTPDHEIVQASVERWYSENDFVPDEVHLPLELDNLEFLNDILRSKRGSAVEILVPKIGEKKKLITMAQANAEFILRDLHLEQLKRDEAIPRAVSSLQRDLRLPRPPRRIECFDNSHLQGTDYVSSMVVFVDGRPKKSEYRKYKIKSFTGNDDFRAMQEVVERRYSRLLEEKQTLPDLIIIDGGKGQLSHAYEILSGLGMAKNVPVIGLAKRLEEVFLPGESDSIILPRTSSSLRLIQQLRDEAHRFAITFHRELRSKRTLQTSLTDIPGIGDKTAHKLLTTIGSVDTVAKSTFDELKSAVGEAAARKVFDYYSTSGNEMESDRTADEQDNSYHNNKE